MSNCVFSRVIKAAHVEQLQKELEEFLEAHQVDGPLQIVAMTQSEAVVDGYPYITLVILYTY